MPRFLCADFVYTCAGLPIPGGIVVIDDGLILDVLPANEMVNDQRVERFDGILCPGFINAHCHLELSHLAGKISQKGGLTGFIRELVPLRGNADATERRKGIEQAEAEMLAGGIVGVGDICNTADTLEVKWKHKMAYHNFIELFDIHPARTDEVMEEGETLARQFANTLGVQKVSLTPHAPYSVSLDLLKRIQACSYDEGPPLSIHNQETKSEDTMFVEGKGELLELLQASGLPQSKRWPTGFSSLASTLVHMPKCNNILLVHNTYSTQADVNWALQYSDRLWWCLCPKANLYIEDRLPDVSMMAASVSNRMVVGTDSYASNTSLSILDELKTLSQHFPGIPLQELLTWATTNGAEFFGWKELGTLEKGKRPGVNLISALEGGNRLHQHSEVKVLVPPNCEESFFNG